MTILSGLGIQRSGIGQNSFASYYSMGQKSAIGQSVVIVALWGIGLSYYFVKSHATEIKKNWAVRRCDPRVIPFAGMINAPPGTDVGEYTAQNLAGCLKEFGKEAAQEATAPAHFLLSSLDNTTKMLGNSVQDARHAVNGIRGSMQAITNTATTRIYNTALPLVRTGITTKSTLNKAQAVTGIGMLAGQSGINMASSFIGASHEFLIAMAMMMIATGTGLVEIPFCLGCPVGIPLLALGTAIITVCIAMTVIVGPAIPNAGLDSCFPGETVIKTDSGESRIDSLKPGAILASGAAVTSVTRAAGKGIAMYKVKNVIVSGSHKVITEDGEQRRVDQLADSTYIGLWNQDLLYSLNTSDGLIEVGGVAFCDWNEWKPDDCQTMCGSKYVQPQNAGLSGDTPLWTERGIVNLSDVVVGDVLFGGANVQAVFEHSPTRTTQCLVGNRSISVTHRLNLMTTDLGIKQMKIEDSENSKIKPTFHLNTNMFGFWVHGEKIANYETTTFQVPQSPRRSVFSSGSV